jgi:hypothetical protein
VGERTVLAGVASKAARDPNKPVVLGAPVCTGYTPNLYERVAASIDWIVPGRVVGLSAETIGGAVTLRWEAPANAPAVAIEDYAIEYRTAGSNEWTYLSDGVSTAPTAKIQNLGAGANIEVRVAGVNAVNAFDSAMRQFASLDYVVGSATTTSTTSTTTSTTTTTLPPYTTTLAPSTTARQIQVGPKPTTSTSPTTIAATTPPATLPPAATTTTTVAPVPATAPQTTATQNGAVAPKPAAAPAVKVEGEDPGFSQPKVTLPAGFTPPPPTQSTTPPVAARPTPAVGVSLSALQIAEVTGTPVPTGSSVSVSAAKGSAKVCRSSGAGVAFLAKGTCRATLRVGTKPGSGKKKNVTLTVP